MLTNTMEIYNALDRSMIFTIFYIHVIVYVVSYMYIVRHIVRHIVRTLYCTVVCNCTMYKCTLRSKGVTTIVCIVVDYEVFRRLQAYFVGFLYLHCILYLLFCNFGAFNLTGTVKVNVYHQVLCLLVQVPSTMP